MSKTASHFPIILLIIQNISDPTQEHRLRDLKSEERNFVGRNKKREVSSNTHTPKCQHLINT